MLRETVARYYALAKPGIIYGNAVTALGGFFLASKGHVGWALLVAMLLGISFVIGSGCVFNNILDQDIDKLMARTKKRALVEGTISARAALRYGIALGVIGAIILGVFTNPLTLGIALFGLFVYVVVYGIEKRRTVHGTLIGSIAGAAPPVVGYCAVTNRFDLGALIVFLIVVIWQMPHFYAIAMYRLNDYKAASIPVLPIKKGLPVTKVYILVYIVAFTIAACSLTFFHYTGDIYLTAAALLGIVWFWIGARSFKSLTYALWGRKMFLFSLVVITVLSAAMSVGAVLR